MCFPPMSERSSPNVWSCSRGAGEVEIGNCGTRMSSVSEPHTSHHTLHVASDVSLSTNFRVKGATISMTGKATIELRSQAIIQVSKKPSMRPIALKVAIPETKQGMKIDRKKLDKIGANLLGNICSPYFMLWEKCSANQKEGWAATGGLRGLESPAWKVQSLSPRLGAEIPPTKSKSYKCCKLFNYLCFSPWF